MGLSGPLILFFSLANYHPNFTKKTIAFPGNSSKKMMDFPFPDLFLRGLSRSSPEHRAQALESAEVWTLKLLCTAPDMADTAPGNLQNPPDPFP